MENNEWRISIPIPFWWHTNPGHITIGAKMTSTEENNLIQGDNTEAFGQHLMRVYLNDPDGVLVGHSISLAEIRFACGLKKSYKNPQFPLTIDLTEEESNKMLVGKNTATLAVWDEKGRKVTPKGGQEIKVGARKV